jgi:hypothetical protein
MIEEKFVKTDEIVLFSSAQKYPRHIYDETKNRKGGPKRKTKEKPTSKKQEQEHHWSRGNSRLLRTHSQRKLFVVQR